MGFSLINHPAIGYPGIPIYGNPIQQKHVFLARCLRFVFLFKETNPPWSDTCLRVKGNSWALGYDIYRHGLVLLGHGGISILVYLLGCLLPKPLVFWWHMIKFGWLRAWQRRNMSTNFSYKGYTTKDWPGATSRKKVFTISAHVLPETFQISWLSVWLFLSNVNKK